MFWTACIIIPHFPTRLFTAKDQTLTRGNGLLPSNLDCSNKTVASFSVYWCPQLYTSEQRYTTAGQSSLQFREQRSLWRMVQTLAWEIMLIRLQWTWQAKRVRFLTFFVGFAVHSFKIFENEPHQSQIFLWVGGVWYFKMIFTFPGWR